MRRIIFAAFVLTACAVFTTGAAAQTDDIREATGLPIPIGGPAIYGQVRVRSRADDGPKPIVWVSLFFGGAQIDRMQANERGYYYFLRRPEDGAYLVFEVNGNEAGRVVLAAGIGSSVRRDIDVDLRGAKDPRRDPGVVVVKNAYARSAEAEKAFDNAMAASKAKKAAEAVEMFKKIVETDPKDFVAWTELGTLYFGDAKYADAEAAYDKALGQKPDFLVALMNIGKLYLVKKQPEKAVIAFTKAANADRASADAFHYLGESYLQMKQGSKAVVALNEAIRLAPDAMADLHLRLAALYNAAGAKDRAAGEYKLFLAKRPDYPDKDKLEKYIKENAK